MRIKDAERCMLGKCRTLGYVESHVLLLAPFKFSTQGGTQEVEYSSRSFFSLKKNKKRFLTKGECLRRFQQCKAQGSNKTFISVSLAFPGMVFLPWNLRG